MTTAARKERKALVVLGMHRSGTSALARVLSLRGAALPRQVLPPNAGNEKGYWEPERVVALNERILQSAGLAWNDAFAPGALEAAGAIDPRFLEEARAIVAAEYGDAPLIVLKDPRCTLLQGFWREALEGLGIAMLPVVISRPPDEVVASLVRRDGTSPLGAALLYAAYGIAAARTPAPAAFLTYGALLADWRAQTDRIGRELGLAWPPLPKGAAAEIARFLGRAGTSPKAAALPADVASLCEATWQCLSRLAAGEPCDGKVLSRVKSALEQRVGDLAPLLRDKNLGWQALSRERDTAFAERDRVLAVFEATEAEMRKAQADHALVQAELLQAREGAARVIEERDTALGERDKALAVFEAAEADLRKARTDHAKVEAALAEARKGAAQVVRERDIALGERDKALAVFKAAEADLRKARADHAKVEAELAEARKGAAQVVRERDIALGERDKALAVFKAAEADLRKARTDHAKVEAELAEARKGAAQVVRERDTALGERDKALAVFKAAEADLRKARADHAKVEAELAEARKGAAQVVRERDTALGERDKALAVFEAAEADLRKARADHAKVEAELAEARKGAAQVVRERDIALGERDKALAVFKAAEADLRKARTDHAKVEAELAEARKGAAQVVRERDTALGERDKALAVFQAAEADLRKARADHAKVEAELAEAHRTAAQIADELATAMRERDEALEALGTLSAERDDLRAERDALQAERDSLLTLYRSTDGLLRKAQADYAAMERRAQLLEGEYRHVATFARELLDSRSWRLTRPLRAATRRLHGHAPMDPVLPAFGASDPAWTAHVEMPSVDAAEEIPPPTQIPQSLNDFLFDEFGPEAAADVTARIRHYRLPVDTREVRSAAALACSEEQAVAWARALASKARPQGEAAPDVSIIVPVYNQVAFTLAAIDSLLSHDSRFTFEILVGDDGSSDATAAALAEPIAGVRHVRHAANLGFVRNCNATAAHARGRYVLFLNNDTQVLPGWLDELVGTLEDDPRVGLAGSKLIYPDGRLQECGAIVWRDGSAWNFGRLQDPRRPEFCYRRDVDYVSGASIALRRELWESLGGFDELFVPAYAEDADLAFRVRAQGLRTVVQPLSQILHFEGISSGTDLGAGAKAYQVDNLRKLYERWKDVLATHRENADAPELEKERDVRGRVLFVDHCTPTPNEDAGSTVAFETMRGFLANGYKVTFIPEDNFAHVGAPTRALQRIGVEAIYHPAYSRMEQFLAQRHDPFDLLFLHRFGVGEAHMAALRRSYPGARVVFLNADMHHLRELREAELAGDPEAVARAEATRERELAVVGAADTTLVHSEFEHALLGRELPGADVQLYPLIHDPVAEVPALEGRSGVCFVGGFRHPPNADGIRWFVETAWPMVRARRPDALLHVVGSHATPEVLALDGHEGVVVEGFIDDLEAYLARRRASVAPLRYGAGAKGKVAQSLALGLPVAGTAIATEGMGLRAGEDVLVADAPEALASHVLRLLEDDDAWQRLSARGLAWAARTTSRASAHERLRRLLGD